TYIIILINTLVDTLCLIIYNLVAPVQSDIWLRFKGYFIACLFTAQHSSFLVRTVTPSTVGSRHLNLLRSKWVAVGISVFQSSNGYGKQHFRPCEIQTATSYILQQTAFSALL